MIKISYEEIKKLARMSNISIHDDELEKIKHQLEQVIGYAARVQAAAPQKEYERVKNSNVFREDIAVRQDPALVLDQAPEEKGNYFVVPLILEGSSSLDNVI